MQMPQLTEGHRKLQLFAGEWRGDETLHPSPWDPKGGPAVGLVHNRSALDGFAVVQDYEQERGGKVTFRGHSVIRYEPAADEYVLHWFDSMGMPPNEFRGRFEGNVLTVHCPMPQGQSRAVFDFRGADRYVHRLDVSGDGSAWQTFMEGTYARVK